MWIGLLGLGLVFLVTVAAFLPIWVVRWLGGNEFQQLASRQVSSLLQTEGDFEPFEWSSFSVYTAGFQSRTGAPGPCLWDFGRFEPRFRQGFSWIAFFGFPKSQLAN
ncbi:MAG: hypothetical protein EBQ51_07755 [Verrucomicrobia bacterium]|nr:hypothetical protein [Verrucomicrobiota bacterium]